LSGDEADFALGDERRNRVGEVLAQLVFERIIHNNFMQLPGNELQ